MDFIKNYIKNNNIINEQYIDLLYNVIINKNWIYIDSDILTIIGYNISTGKSKFIKLLKKHFKLNIDYKIYYYDTIINIFDNINNIEILEKHKEIIIYKDILTSLKIHNRTTHLILHPKTFENSITLVQTKKSKEFLNDYNIFKNIVFEYLLEENKQLKNELKKYEINKNFNDLTIREDKIINNIIFENCGIIKIDETIYQNNNKKELNVFNFIKNSFKSLNIIYNKRIGNGCHHRPDILIELNYKNIIIEIDERQHKSYKNDEDIRYNKIIKALNFKPILFIRFNPDKYIDKNNNIIKSCWSVTDTGVIIINNINDWNKRLNNLKKIIDDNIDIQQKKIFEIIYLYYDENI